MFIWFSQIISHRTHSNQLNISHHLSVKYTIISNYNKWSRLQYINLDYYVPNSFSFGYGFKIFLDNVTLIKSVLSSRATKLCRGHTFYPSHLLSRIPCQNSIFIFFTHLVGSQYPKYANLRIPKGWKSSISAVRHAPLRGHQ